jgi:ankyrin repeat protein
VDALSVIDHLAEHGVVFSQKNKDTALRCAVKNDHAMTALRLIELGSSVSGIRSNKGQTMLMYACLHEHQVAFETLIQRGVSVNEKGKFGLTPLLVVCQTGDMLLFNRLIALGAGTSETDSYGKSPLSYAAAHGHFDMMAELARLGVSMDVIDRYENTALSYALKNRDLSTVIKIIDLGASMNHGDDSDTLLKFAVRQESFEVLVKMVEKSHLCEFHRT